MGWSVSYQKLFLFVFLWFFHIGKSDIAADKTALLVLRSAVRGKPFLWNETEPTPCRWQGVTCDQNRVTNLRLPGAGLSGEIPSGIFGNLTNLRIISFRHNSLTGKIPSDLALCTDLHNINFKGNQFSGDIPAFLYGIRNLVRLDLSGNNFSGEISPAVNDLTKLITLYLENNELNGSIPEINLPNLVEFNVSFNRLNGSIPSKLRSMKADAFEGNSLCGGPLGSCPNESKKKKLSGGAIAGIIIGSVIGFLLILLILFILSRRKSSRKSKSIDITSAKKPLEMEILGEKTIEHGKNGSSSAGHSGMVAKPEINSNTNKKLVFFGNASKFFELDDLLRASAEVLGRGTFGTAYKVVLEVGTLVSVKRLKDVSVPEKEFREKIDAIGSIDHGNLVPLRAYYYSNNEKLLVYDYMPMGSLSSLLHGNSGAGRTPLNWESRSGIALGAARGIEYLHSLGPGFSHGNIKSSNVLLTRTYDACVSDFGLANLVGHISPPNHISGYRAPEVTDACKVSQKADIYSFGVLLLELLTGKAPAHALLNEDGIDLPRWVQSVVQEEWTSEVFDLELLRYQNGEEEMVQLLQLAIDCTAQYPDKRPSMSEVSRQIEEICRSSLQEEEDADDVS